LSAQAPFGASKALAITAINVRIDKAETWPWDIEQFPQKFGKAQNGSYASRP
jgi:hypothetical protein